MKLRSLILSLVCLAGLVACEVNTMYNARNYFKAAQERPLNNQGRPNAQAIDEYTKAIKKCGIIIAGNKKGAKLDEAYYLMSRALYYKGNSAFQAKDQFENLINRFPKSPYVPDAHIYIARILRDINQPREAEKKLDEYIRNPAYKKHHPKALFLMADFAIKDKNYARAQYYLERIIDGYPKTKEYREAYLLFGKNYLEQKDYTNSLLAFEKMMGARGIDKTMKLDGAYYIGLNHLELGELDKAYRTIKSLAKSEARPERIPVVKLLKARIHFAQGDSTAAISEIDQINKTYPRTESAAGAYYYLAEYNYYTMGNATKAVANYNRVRTEFSASPLSSKGQAKATALGNVTPRANLNSETNLTQFVDYQYQAAESFLGALALPDSAKARYRKVIGEKAVLTAVKDSLLAMITTKQATLDSLNLVLASIKPDSLSTQPAIPDSSISLVEKLESDTLLVGKAISDSSMAVADSVNQVALVQAAIQQEQSEITAAETRLTTLNDNLARFDTEIIPFCMFAIGSVLHDYTPDSPEKGELLATMQAEYPENKYTRALVALLSGQEVRLIDPQEEKQEQRLDLLLGQMEAQPDSALVGLAELGESTYDRIKLTANYRLGWYYSFEAVDTLAAKEYLNKVLADTKAEEFATVTRMFYDGTNFLLHEKAEPAPQDTLTAVPEAREWSFPTAAEIFSTLPDSLKIYADMPALVDSLSKSVSVPAPPTEELPIIDTPQPDLPATPENEVDKKEESPLE